jgi:hypothetical protein
MAGDPVAPSPAEPPPSPSAGQPPSPAGSAVPRHPALDLLDTVGGPAALIDSAAPTIVFALTYTLGHRHLTPALIAAVGTAVILGIWRLVRRQPLQTVATGVLGIALAAGVAEFTGRASDYYLISIVRAVGLAAVYAVSALIGWPVIGLLVGAAAGNPSGFRQDPEQLRAYKRVTWFWVGLFVLRLAVRGPLLLANEFGWLSVTDVVMGWPLFLAWTALTYVLLRRWLHGSVWQAAHEGIVARNASTRARAAARRGTGAPAPGASSRLPRAAHVRPADAADDDGPARP